MQPYRGPRAGPVISATDNVGAHSPNRIGVVSVTAAKGELGNFAKFEFFFLKKYFRKFNPFFLNNFRVFGK
jgi:hypothetical protein